MRRIISCVSTILSPGEWSTPFMMNLSRGKYYRSVLTRSYATPGQSFTSMTRRSTCPATTSKVVLTESAGWGGRQWHRIRPCSLQSVGLPMPKSQDSVEGDEGPSPGSSGLVSCAYEFPLRCNPSLVHPLHYVVRAVDGTRL